MALSAAEAEASAAVEQADLGNENKGNNEMSKKNKETKKKSGCLTTLFVMALFICVPVIITKQCTSKTDSTASQAVASESAETDASTTDTTATGIDSSSSDVTSNADALTDNGYYSSTPRPKSYTKGKDGIYKLVGPVMDTANVLTDSEYAELDSFLRNLDETTGVQIAVLTVESLDDEGIESYSLKHAEAWQLGQNGVDNGALLTVAMNAHSLRIETGYGTEGTLTDAKCAQIIRNVIVPEFKKGNYGTGIVNGVKNMAGIITSNSELVTVSDNPDDDSAGTELSELIVGIIVVLIILFVLVMQIIMSIARRLSPLSWLGRTGQRIHDANVERASHSSSGGSGGGSSYHSFSGGGGSFGGGGASGGW